MKKKSNLIFTLITFVLLTFVPNIFAQNASPQYVVRVIYFIPNDLQPKPDIDNILDTEIKEAQQFYADQMEVHGFERKTFRFEANANGNVLVHHLRGEFNDLYYQNRSIGSSIVWDEVGKHFDTANNIYVLVLESKNHYLDGTNPKSGENIILGRGGGDSRSGTVLLPAVDLHATIHELGHAFGLQHDSRVHAKRIYTALSPARDWMISSFCVAEWLDVHRYFNPTQKSFNQNTSVQMLTPVLDSPPHAIRLQFEVSDPDGLYQAHLFKPFGDATIIGCKRLDDKTTTIVEFVTTDLIGGNSVTIIVMDKNGNFIWNTFPIDITNLLAQADSITIPDPNLASALREAIGLSPGAAITQIDMLKLTNFVVPERQITDLTGLEHAIRLRRFVLQPNQIHDITPISKMKELTQLSIRNNNISNIHPVSELAYLEDLIIRENNIVDITPITSLSELTYLVIVDNPVSDITPISFLTNLQNLELDNVRVSDISPVRWEKLVNLEHIRIHKSPLSDITPLSSLTNIKSISMQENNIVKIPAFLELQGLQGLSIVQNKITDITPIATLKNLTSLDLRLNQISNIRPISQITNLKSLELSKNQIIHIKPVAELNNLQSLGLAENQIRDISALSGLTNLQWLGLVENQIVDLNPLTGLNKLEMLALANNQISDVSPLIGLINLRFLSLVNNPIKNSKPLLTLLRSNPHAKIYLTNNYNKPLPVNLSRFRAERTDEGVVLKWTTESELNNAGFYLYRSETKNGDFKLVSTTMIQGAGTTGKRNEYTWTDSTAKPNTVYYYRIEDVSYTGDHTQLATVRLRGSVSAKGKVSIAWADLKMSQ